jgi:pimeloyl-ACP methyl ester carboxylesterase
MKVLRAGSAGLMALLIAACGSSHSADSGTASGTSSSETSAAATASCANPTPASAIDQTLTENIPSDFDASANPAPNTTIAFSLLLPARCPGDVFPLILQSHGYGGNRLKTLAADGTLHPQDPHFKSIDELVQALPYHGYVVISYDERGHGDSTNANARIIDPRAEVQDAIQILNWAYDNAATYNIQTLPDSGIAKDLNVGTIGYSYGGGFEMPLAALDPRIKTIVPNGTWNDLLYSLLPGDAVKLSFDGLLCLLAATAQTSATPPIGVHNTPLVATLCNAVGLQGPMASTLRTRSDLVNAMGAPTALPRTVAESELDPFFFTHSTAYFQQQEQAGQPWGFGESQAKLRAVPALFLQGNRDNLFNLTEAYFNDAYFSSTGADVRMLSTEGGHMNPLAGQLEGPANCGSVAGVNSILAWFDNKLKGQPSALYNAIPKVCISVAATPTVSATATSYSGTAVGVGLNAYPVGSLSGAGAIPTTTASLSATVPVTATAPVFVPVTTISVSGAVIAGSPRIADLTVSQGMPMVQTAVAYVGVGIQRGGSTFLVDDQVSGFVAGDHTNNRGTDDSAVLLPGIGEQLQPGDVVGLLFYQQHVQYAAIISANLTPGVIATVDYAEGASIPPITSTINLSSLALPNPYSVTITQLELPIFIPGQYAGSSLLQ